MHEVRDEFVLFGPGICRFFKGETNIVLNRHPFEEAIGMEVETPVAFRIWQLAQIIDTTQSALGTRAHVPSSALDLDRQGVTPR